MISRMCVYKSTKEKEKDYQGEGIATKFEYSVGEKARIGASYMSEKSELEETNPQIIKVLQIS